MTVATSRALVDRISALYGPALWTVAGVVLYVLGGLGSILLLALVEQAVLEPLGMRAESGTLGLSVRNGLHALVWGLLVAGIAVPLGRRLVPGVRFRPTAWATLAVGLMLAAVVITVGEEHVRARFGYFDSEFQGLTFFTGPAIIAVAVATWAALAVPGEGVIVPGAAALTAVAGVALSLLPSVPSATDGIGAESVPLLAAFLAGVAYAVVMVLLILRRLVGPPA